MSAPVRRRRCLGGTGDGGRFQFPSLPKKQNGSRIIAAWGLWALVVTLCQSQVLSHEGGVVDIDCSRSRSRSWNWVVRRNEEKGHVPNSWLASLRGGDDDDDDDSTAASRTTGVSSPLATTAASIATAQADTSQDSTCAITKESAATADVPNEEPQQEPTGKGLEESEPIWVTKRDGNREHFDSQKLLRRLQALSNDLDGRYVNLDLLAESITRGTYPNITTEEIDILATETAASMSTQHPDYARLAARIFASHLHKITPDSFSQAMQVLHKSVEGESFMDPEIVRLVQKYASLIDARVQHDRDFLHMNYFGLKTLERVYLIRTKTGRLVERPQYLLMRVALGIHCVGYGPDDQPSEETERARLEAAFETYDLMSQGYFLHASPTLFHSGTRHPQLSSCFLLQMSDDSISGIYDTLKNCALISKSAGGIGLSVHNIRARGTYIKGTRGVSNGLVPMLRVFDVTSRYVDQGGGRRPGAFAIYMEPWHGDVLDVLQLKKNHGKEEQRARNLFYGLWIPDLFMRRVEADEMWSLMCPHQCPGLETRHGADFDQLYTQYESEGRFLRQVRARELWSAILDAQIETGTPYMLYKDAANAKSNQQNLGTIQCSNLCAEIIQYTDKSEVAVCNLACLCLPKFVISKRGPFGSIDPTVTEDDTEEKEPLAYFDHGALHRVAKVVTRNCNRVITGNLYPIPEAKRSNFRHRPIGIGVTGLADVFARLGLPFSSDEAKALNEAIFETIYHALLEASAESAEEEGPYETFDGSPASRGLLQYHLWGMTDEETPSRRRCRPQEAATTPPTLPRQERRVHEKYAPSVERNGYDWPQLRQRIQSTGLRNSLLVAPMPTASTSQILGANECIEPYVSNMYLRRVKAGEFILMNPHLLQDLTDAGLWNRAVRNQLMRDNGSIANIANIPPRLKELYKTVWELKMKKVIDMAADRGRFIDQSQSLNLFVADPTVDKLTAMHFYAWKKGLKTGMYYLRTKPAVNAIQYTVETTEEEEESARENDDDDNDDDDEPRKDGVHEKIRQGPTVCLSCQG